MERSGTLIACQHDVCAHPSWAWTAEHTHSLTVYTHIDIEINQCAAEQTLRL